MRAPENIQRRIVESPWEFQGTACWMWTGALEDGYGRARFQGRMTLVHRLMYELFVGVIPPEMHIDHLCKVRACCNPAHLEVVTPAENRRRAFEGFTPKTHCPVGHEYTPDNTWAYPNALTTVRACKICHRLRSREWYRANKGGKKKKK